MNFFRTGFCGSSRANRKKIVFSDQPFWLLFGVRSEKGSFLPASLVAYVIKIVAIPVNPKLKQKLSYWLLPDDLQLAAKLF